MFNLLNLMSMKKFFSFGLVLLLALTIQAQNYPQLFGIKVGQSTSSEVVQKLTNLGIEHDDEDGLIMFESDFGWLGTPMKLGMYMEHNDKIVMSLFMGENLNDGLAEKFMKDVRVKYNEYESVMPEIMDGMLEEISGTVLDVWSQDGEISMIACSTDEAYGVILYDREAMFALVAESLAEEVEEMSDEDFFELLMQVAEEYEEEEDPAIVETKKIIEEEVSKAAELLVGKQVDFMTKCTGITFDGRDVTYVYEVDESYISLSQLDMEQIKNVQLQLVDSIEMFQVLKDNLKTIGGTIKYVYVGSLSQEVVSYSLW
jgi:hypothetical protein